MKRAWEGKYIKVNFESVTAYGITAENSNIKK
jgi:hypothetical protein